MLYIDELRVSVGIARWTSNFTPPNEPYDINFEYDGNIVLTIDPTSQYERQEYVGDIELSISPDSIVARIILYTGDIALDLVLSSALARDRIWYGSSQLQLDTASVCTLLPPCGIYGSITYDKLIFAEQFLYAISGTLELSGYIHTLNGYISSIRGSIGLSGNLYESLTAYGTIFGNIPLLTLTRAIGDHHVLISGNLDIISGELIRVIQGIISAIAGSIPYDVYVSVLLDILDSDIHCVVINVHNFSITEYSNFPFNGFAMIGDKCIASNQNGLYVIEENGADSGAISSHVQYGFVDLWDPVKKVPLQAWITGRYNGQIIITVELPDGKVYEYPVDRIGLDVNEARSKFGRGLRSRFMKFGFKNKAGSDFDIDSVNIIADVVREKKR